MAGVSTTHTLYDSLKDQWLRCRDCIAGEDVIKSRKTKYLPMLDSHKLERIDKGTTSRYDDYLQRTLFYNAVGRTVAGLAGAIFQKAPSIDVDAAAKDQITDVTLTDEPLEIFALNTTREYLTTGRFGILIDMSSDPSTTPRPYWALYQAEDIVNWRFENLGGDKELVLVVLRETIEEQNPDDEFDIKQITQYRVLRLSNIGVYTQQLYKEVASEEAITTTSTLGLNTVRKIDFVPGPILTPMRRGVPLNFIPFSLPFTIGVPPLIDLVSVNLSHYRAVADLKHGLHYTALPTPWVSGQKGDTSKPLAIGSGTAWDLDVNGKAGMLEFTGRGLAAIRADIQDMQAQMATLGARLLEPAPRYAETALSVSMRHSSDYATLRMIAQEVEQRISYALKIHCWWLGTEPLVAKLPVKIELNKVFFDASVTADELRALLMALQASTISFKTFYERLSNTGWTREGITAEEELKDIEADGDQFVQEKPGLQQPDPKSTAPGSKPTPMPVS